MPTNDFQIYAGAGGANVITTSAYAALSARTAGFATGLARSNQLNKVWRQSSIVSAMLAQAISDTLGVDVVDDGTIATIETHFYQMLMRQVQTNEFVVDSSAIVNTITIAPSPVILSYYNGLVLRIKVANQNTGTVVINANTLGNKSLLAGSGAVLTGGAFYAGQTITVIFDTTSNAFKMLGADVPFLGNHQYIVISTTFVVPAGVRLIRVGLQAGGAGASGSTTTQPGGGGGGGEFRLGVFAVTPGQSIVVTIGGGGAGGAIGANGLNGNASSFGALMTSNPGGFGSLPSTGASSGGGGGSGGSGGILSVPGGSGGDGWLLGTVLPAYGGSSFLCGSVRAGTGGSNAPGIGGGGSGAYGCIVDGVARIGGAGAQGSCLVEW